MIEKVEKAFFEVLQEQAIKANVPISDVIGLLYLDKDKNKPLVRLSSGSKRFNNKILTITQVTALDFTGIVSGKIKGVFNQFSKKYNIDATMFRAIIVAKENSVNIALFDWSNPERKFLQEVKLNEVL